MYLRTIARLCFAVIFVGVGLVTSPAHASTRNHYHYSNHHLDLRSEYSWWWFDPHPGTRAAHVHRWHRDLSSDFGMASLHGQLATKAREIVASCGSTVISGWRPGARIAGSGHASLHASGRAVDIRGNPHCIYSHLQGWPGGYSVDYGSVQHVHISLGGFEDGVRFSHYGSYRRHRYI
jgi:hypothetical protein